MYSVVFFIKFCYNITIMKFEADIINFLQTNASIGWITLFQLITTLGSYLGFLIVFCILFFKNRKLSYTFVATFIVASVFNHFLKAVIMRDRPFVTYPSIINYGGEDGYSMPSGHSMCGALFATFIFYLILKSHSTKGTKALGGICCALFAILIAYSRMVLGVHYLTDTIAGIFEGILFAIIGIYVYNLIVKKSKKNAKEDTIIKL